MADEHRGRESTRGNPRNYSLRRLPLAPAIRPVLRPSPLAPAALVHRLQWCRATCATALQRCVRSSIPLRSNSLPFQAFGLVCSASSNSHYDGKLAYVPALEDVLVWDVKKGQMVRMLSFLTFRFPYTV